MPKSQALDLFSASSTDIGDLAVSAMLETVKGAALAKDTRLLTHGIKRLDAAIDWLKYVRVEAGRRTYELLPDHHYKHRGEDKVRKDREVIDGVLVEPALSGGGWHRIDFSQAFKSVASRIVGMDSRIIDREGEVRMTVEEFVAYLLDCFTFSGLKSNAEKRTGLAAWNFERSDFGEYDEPRRDVRVTGPQP